MMARRVSITCAITLLIPALMGGMFCRVWAVDSYSPLPDDEYVSVRNGHMVHNGKRLRLWGVNFCNSIKRQGKDLELTFDRLTFCGFNAVRLNYAWYMLANTGKDTITVPETVVGSGSQIDRLDHAVYLAKQRGMFFWFSFDVNRGFMPSDYDVLPDDGTRSEWEQLIQEGGVPFLVYIDGRAERVFHKYAQNVLNHVNPYTGRRYADEETIGLYEVFNENAFIEDVLSRPRGGVVGKRLRQKWNRWLREKYGNDGRLARAWGKLEDGESLARASVEFAPLMDSEIRELPGYQKEYVGGGEQGARYPEARAQDVMLFVYDLYVGFHDRFERFVRSLGSCGRGISVVPITPTGRYDQSLALYYGASCGDFVSVGNYGFAMRPWAVSRDDPLYPWVVRVNGPPLMENPIDLVRVKGKPYLVYEINDYRPNPYTVEFPMRVALNAVIRDADGVFWFNWDDNGYLPPLRTDEDYRRYRLPMPDSNYPNAGLVMGNDQAALAAIKSAGALFRSGGLKPPGKPVTAVIGGDLLLTLHDHSIAPITGMLRAWAWTTGVQLVYDTSRRTRVRAVLPSPEGHRVQAGSHITFDWSEGQGFMRVDAPTAKAHVGFCQRHLNFDGIRVTKLNCDFLHFAMVALDGRPLERSSDVLLSMTSRGTNTGLTLDPARMEKPWAEGLAQAVVDPGREPVIYERVSGAIRAEWLEGRWYRKVDFARDCYEQGRVGAALVVAPDEPLFFARITKEPPPPAVRKVLIVGNSITRHGPNADIGWPNDCGMAATRPERDFVHLLYDHIRAAQPQQPPELVLANIRDEQHMHGIEHLLSCRADLVIIQLGDNYRGSASVEELQKPYEDIIASLGQEPGARVFCVGTWGNSSLDPFISAAAVAQGAIYVALEDLAADSANRAAAEGHFAHSGVAWHPGDRGMHAIAERLWEHVKVCFKVQ